MKNILTNPLSISLLSGLLLISGCSSDDGGSGAAPAPANAILIDSSLKAENTMTTAVVTGEVITAAFGAQTTNALTGKDIINMVLKKARSKNQSTVAVATGVAFEEACDVKGFASGDETETATSYSATVTLSECDDGDDFALTGSFTVSSTFPAAFADGPYTQNASGNLTITFSGGNVGFNGFSYIESGDTSTGAYKVTTFTYAINPSTGGGYAVTLTQPLVGSTFQVCELTGGQVLVTGAAGSQARGTFNSDETVTVEFHSGDGNFVATDNSPLSCLI